MDYWVKGKLLAAMKEGDSTVDLIRRLSPNEKMEIINWGVIGTSHGRFSIDFQGTSVLLKKL